MPLAAGLYYETHGRAAAPPLILSAGLGGSGGYWQPNLAALVPHFRVITYDHRGTGASDRALSDTVAVDDLARDMLAILDDAGIASASVIGHALGGIAGLALVRIAPQRVQRLVVVNGWIAADPATLRCFDARLHILAGGGARAYLQAQPIFLYPATWIAGNDDRLAAEAGQQLAHFPGGDTLTKRIDAIRAFDAGGWIGQLATPTLALAARDDVLVPWTASAALADAAPAIDLATMDWGGHACNVTDAAGFDRLVLAFLRS